MRKVLFAQQNYEKSPPYRVLTTIEQDGDDVRVYKRACSPAATPYVHSLLDKQRLLQEFIGDRATIVLGRLEQDDRISYPFVRLPTVQLLIGEWVLQGDYAGAYAFLKQWMDWISALATIEAAADDNTALVEVYGENLPREPTTCLPLSLLDLTLDNVLWDRQNDRYYLIDHEFVFPGPAPVTLVRFRSLFYLCLRLHAAFAAAAHSHPLRLISHPHFLVPAEWDIDVWIAPDQWPLLFAGERQLQEHYGIRVDLEYVGEHVLQARPHPNVGARIAQLQWDLDIIQQQAAQREQTLAALNGQVAQREQMLATLNGQVAQQEQSIATLEATNIEQEQTIATLQATNTEQEQTVATLQTANTKQEQTIATLQTANTEQEQTIAALQTASIEQVQTVAALRVRDAEREQTLTTLETRLHEVESYWGRVQMSAGWALLQQLRRLRLRLAPSGSRRERVLKRAVQRLRTRKLKDSRGVIQGREHDRAQLETLMMAIDTQIPDSLTIGKGNVLYLAGWCYHPQTALRRLELMVNDAVYPVNIRSMPRRDVRDAFYPHRDPKGHSFRSGFWSFVPFQECHQEQQVELNLRAKLRNGATAVSTYATITVKPGIETEPLAASGFERRPQVAICMTTYNPRIELFSRQIDSIRGQTYSNWICIISDDHSRAEIFEQIHDIVGADERFQVYRNPSNLGFYQNFERCLELVPRNIAYIALCDQDDYWHNDKLETLITHFADGTTLVYSDMNIINESGDRIAQSYWIDRPNNYRNLASLLMANTITGAACIFKGELLPFILPFPQKIGELYHDHWIGSVALTMGDIQYVDRPLYDYVQHSANVIGHYVPPLPKQQLLRLTRDVANVALRTNKRDRIITAWNAIYHGDILRLKSMAYILELRCGNRIAHQKRRTLRRFVKLDESPLGSAWLLIRGITRNTVHASETMGAEYYLIKGILWKEYTLLKGWLKKWYRVDNQHSTIHHDYPEPTHNHPTMSSANNEQVDIIQQKIAPLALCVSDTAPRRVNILVPTVDLSHFFGGYITKFNLARRLAEEGLKVRLVTVDPTPELPLSWRQQLQAYQGLEKLFDHVELVHAYDRTIPLEVSRDDAFIATTWWTAHIAHRAVHDIDKQRFIYLIQEYEPFTFPMGTFAALATQTYTFPHFAVFSSELLQDYFRKNALGIFSESAEIGERHSLSFQNAITAVGNVTVEQLANRSPKRLLFYARPEQHAARNMFELAILALAQAIEAGCFTGAWEFFGIGTINTSGNVKLAKGFDLQLLPRQSQSVYRDLLLAHDVGLSLMYTPHPSLVPIEMASAGMVVVTNTYANKTQESLRAISSNFVAVEPTIEAVRRGLKEAVARMDDYAQRVQGSHVNWSTCWEQTFNLNVIAQIRAFIEGV